MYFVIFHQYDTPTFKTKALRLVTNEGRLKRLLLLYKRLIQPYLSLVWQRILSFSTSATHSLLKLKHSILLVKKGGVKCLLLLYKWLIRPYLGLLWLLLATHFVTRVTPPIKNIDGKNHKMELKSSRNYSTYHLKSKSRH